MNRKEKAEAIARNPEAYMVCVGCRSLLNRQGALICPVCHAYGYDYRNEAVMHVARELGQRQDTTIPWL